MLRSGRGWVPRLRHLSGLHPPIRGNAAAIDLRPPLWPIQSLPAPSSIASPSSQSNMQVSRSGRCGSVLRPFALFSKSSTIVPQTLNPYPAPFLFFPSLHSRSSFAASSSIRTFPLSSSSTSQFSFRTFPGFLSLKSSTPRVNQTGYRVTSAWMINGSRSLATFARNATEGARNRSSSTGPSRSRTLRGGPRDDKGKSENNQKGILSESGSGAARSSRRARAVVGLRSELMTRDEFKKEKGKEKESIGKGIEKPLAKLKKGAEKNGSRGSLSSSKERQAAKLKDSMTTKKTKSSRSKVASTTPKLKGKAKYVRPPGDELENVTSLEAETHVLAKKRERKAVLKTEEQEREKVRKAKRKAMRKLALKYLYNPRSPEYKRILVERQIENLHERLLEGEVVDPLEFYQAIRRRCKTVNNPQDGYMLYIWELVKVAVNLKLTTSRALGKAMAAFAQEGRMNIAEEVYNTIRSAASTAALQSGSSAASPQLPAPESQQSVTGLPSLATKPTPTTGLDMTAPDQLRTSSIEKPPASANQTGDVNQSQIAQHLQRQHQAGQQVDPATNATHSSDATTSPSAVAATPTTTTTSESVLTSDDLALAVALREKQLAERVRQMILSAEPAHTTLRGHKYLGAMVGRTDYERMIEAYCERNEVDKAFAVLEHLLEGKDYAMDKKTQKQVHLAEKNRKKEALKLGSGKIDAQGKGERPAGSTAKLENTQSEEPGSSDAIEAASGATTEGKELDEHLMLVAENESDRAAQSVDDEEDSNDVDEEDDEGYYGIENFDGRTGDESEPTNATSGSTSAQQSSSTSVAPLPVRISEDLVAALVLACGRAGQLDRAWNLVNQLEARNYPLSIVTYNKLIVACADAKEPTRGLTVPQLMRSKSLALNPGTSLALVKCHLNLGQRDTALQLARDTYKALPDHMRSYTKFWNRVLNEFANGGAGGQAWALWKFLRNGGTDGQQLGNGGDRSVVSNGGPVPNLSTYHALIRASGSDRDLLPRAHGALLDMQKFWNLKPDVHCYNLIAQGYARQGDLPGAFRQIHKINNAGLHPNEETLAVMMKAMKELTVPGSVLKQIQQSNASETNVENVSGLGHDNDKEEPQPLRYEDYRHHLVRLAKDVAKHQPKKKKLRPLLPPWKKIQLMKNVAKRRKAREELDPEGNFAAQIEKRKALRQRWEALFESRARKLTGKGETGGEDAESGGGKGRREEATEKKGSYWDVEFSEGGGDGEEVEEEVEVAGTEQDASGKKAKERHPAREGNRRARRAAAQAAMQEVQHQKTKGSPARTQRQEQQPKQVSQRSAPRKKASQTSA